MHQRKSKAWIIVLVVVIILVIVVYSLFSNKEQIFGTKNAENITKTFSPLLGSSKKKDTVTPSNTPADTNNTGNGTGSTSGNTTGTNSGGGFGTGSGFTTGSGQGTGEGFGGGTGAGSSGGFGTSTAYTPPLNPLPTPTSGGSAPTTPTTPIITTNPTPIVTPPNPNICPDDPLVFTDGEKDELAVLLRQYYLIAPTIRAEDDLDIVTTDLTANQALLAQVDTLTNQCNAQKTNIGYAGPQTVKDNPYYTSPTGAGTTPYLPSFSQLEEIFNIW